MIMVYYDQTYTATNTLKKVTIKQVTCYGAQSMPLTGITLEKIMH